MSGDGPATANGDTEVDPEELHSWGLPIDLWAHAVVGKIDVFYTAGEVIFICQEGFASASWDVACDLYLPEDQVFNHSDYDYCSGCQREVFHFKL